MRLVIQTNMPKFKIIPPYRNSKRFREIRGIKQDALAYELGDDWNQKKISLLEQKESVEKDILEQVAKILKVPTIISNTASFDNCQQPAFFNNQPSFKPIDKVVELYDEKIALYERMLKKKEDMMAILEKLIEGK
ncbi:XRE family transcriptional regulator [Sphingobacterium spiritivorum]|uniref:XRE family transcriptional regulator n=2 Tax=Sphingobacterium spiritivorum TaxID=258 RepID=UPI003DA437CC